MVARRARAMATASLFAKPGPFLGTQADPQSLFADSPKIIQKDLQSEKGYLRRTVAVCQA